VLSDTALVPDDGMTAGSGTTPRTVPAVRQGAAAARRLLVQLACQRWNVEPEAVEVQDGKITHPASKRSVTYAELAQSDEAVKAFGQPPPTDVTLSSLKDWKVLGTSVVRPNGREIVTGAHKYASDFTRPGMLHGKVLRSP